MNKKKERPCDIRQQMNRIRASRDNLKNLNKEKALISKKLRIRNAELIENRDQWKARTKELDRQLRLAQEEIKQERSRADRENKRAENLQNEIEKVWGKKSRA